MNLALSNKRVADYIRGIRPYDGIEQEHINDALRWIENAINIYRIEKPDKPPKHLVSYFVLIDPEHKRLLLADHIKAQLWLPSGGHVELEEDPRDTVIREIREELQLEAIFVRNNEKPFFLSVTQTVGLTAGHTDVSLWYLVQGHVREHIQFDRREFISVQWFTFDEVLGSEANIFDPHMQRFTRKLVNYLKDSR